MLKRPRIHSRTEQARASFTHGHPYVSEEHAFRIPMAPVEPSAQPLVALCHRTREIRTELTADGLVAMKVAGQNLDDHRIWVSCFPRRVSCFPAQGFMFSLMGFHVFPLRVSCFPSWGFMFSLSRHLSKIPHAAFDIKSKWPETSKRCLVLDNYQLPEQAGNALNGLYMEHSLRAMRLQDRALESWVGRQTRCAMCRQYTNVFIPLVVLRFTTSFVVHRRPCRWT